MQLHSEQYERIAQWLDGEAVELSAEELSAAREIRQDEVLLRGSLPEMAVPPRVLAGARRRLRAELARPTAVRARFIWLAAAGAIAASILMTLAAYRNAPPAPISPQREMASAVPVELWVQTVETPPGGEAIHLLSDEMDRFEAEVVVSKPPSVMDRQIDTVQQDIDNFWNEESSLDNPQS